MGEHDEYIVAVVAEATEKDPRGIMFSDLKAKVKEELKCDDNTAGEALCDAEDNGLIECIGHVWMKPTKKDV